MRGILASVFLFLRPVFAAEPSISAGLAQTPPMGWNSWNRFHCDVNESLIRQTADAMASNGMKEAGYQYIVIDDCWQVWRQKDGTIVADPKRFPSGMKAVADYVHAKGLKFGLYSCAGDKTCQRRPGSKGHEAIDAKQYAAWGVDYVKYDWCYADGVDPRAAYRTMRAALDAAGRPMVLSMCEWGKSRPWTWARGVAHLWRTTGDVEPCRDCKRLFGGLGWMDIVDLQDGLEKYAGPGGWNDPDMLEVGNPGMSAADDRGQFSFWALLAAPLMAGNDLRSMSGSAKAVLTNKEVIAVDQDPLGAQGRRVRRAGDADVWMKPLSGGDVAVILSNRGKKELAIGVSWAELGLSARDVRRATDLWSGEDFGPLSGRFEAAVPPKDLVLIRLRR